MDTSEGPTQTLTMTFNELLDPNSVPGTARFRVRITSSLKTLTVTNTGVSGRAVWLTLDPAVTADDQMELDYNSICGVTSAGPCIRDLAGNGSGIIEVWPVAHGPPSSGGGFGGGGGGSRISSDASLSDLSGSASVDGEDFGETLSLSPAFDASTEDYTAAVPFSKTHVRLTPAVNQRDATLKVGPLDGKLAEVESGQPGPAFALVLGENVFEIEVTAEDGDTVETYTVTVTRAPPPLGDLTARADGEALTLTPAFDAATADYTATAPFDATHARLTPTSGQPDATVRIGPRGGELAEAESGEPGLAHELTVGENVFEIEVTDADGAVAVYTVTVTLPPPPVPLDESAVREHLFPLLADGDGFRSRLFLTNASAYARNDCALELHGTGLDVARFEEHPALTVANTGIDIDLKETGVGVALATAGAGPLAFGYAKLSCAEPAVARLLLVLESGGAPAALTHQESARPARSHRFALPPRLGRPGLLLTNDGAEAAACAIEAETAAGEAAGGGNVAVPAHATVFRFLDELVPAADEPASGEAAMVTCDRPVAALGVPLSAGGVFAALTGAVPETGAEAPARQMLPLILDGGGFRSRLEVTNRSAAANRCMMDFHGAGVNTYRFADTEGVTRDGFGRALLELPPDGRVALTSFGRHSYAYGHAVLDCEGPVDARVLLTAGDGDEVAGMAQIPSAQFAREFRFPVAPGLERMALFLTGAGETDAVCEVSLTAADGREAAGPPIGIGAESTALRFLADLIESPADIAGGAVALRCDGPVAAVSLPFAGAAFAAVPPVVRGFQEDGN